jgi:hypothetical protein
MEETTSRRDFRIKPPLVKMPQKQTNKPKKIKFNHRFFIFIRGKKQTMQQNQTLNLINPKHCHCVCAS